MSESNLIIYQSDDGSTKIETRLENETVWLKQEQMSQLFQRERSVITKHINNVFREGELDEKSNVQYLHISGSDKPVKFYNLDVIISVGYRVKSLQGTKFRQWATTRLREYIIKGFTMNDDMLKEAGGGAYFDELLARIRDIRSSEKRFYQKIRDLFAISSDYDPSDKATQMFFAEVQNKLLFAVTGMTAAELITNRADASQINMALTSWKGKVVRKQDIYIAKNYLTEDELDTLNRYVVSFLETAELRAKSKKDITMNFWRERVDKLIEMNDDEVLTHQGKISHAQMEKLVLDVYDEFDSKRKTLDAQNADEYDLKELEELNDKLKNAKK
jgi:hypothetical protein